MSTLTELHREMMPELRDLEEFRLAQKTEIAKGKKLYYLPVSLAVGGVLLGITGATGGFALIGISVLLFLLIWGFKIHPARKKFNEEFKEGALTALIQRLHPGVEYEPKNYVDKDTFKRSGLYGYFNRYEGEDYLRGRTAEGCQFSFSELNVISHSDDSSTTIFKGLFFTFKTPHHYGARIKILPDSAEKAFGKFGKLLQSAVGGWGRKGAKMVYFEEYPEFEKLFVVYSDDEASARRALTPQLVDFVMDLRERWDDKLSLAFVDDTLYVGLPYKKDLLVPDIHQDATDSRFFARLVDELAPGFAMVEDLRTLYALSTGENAHNPLPADPRLEIDERIELQDRSAPKERFQTEKKPSLRFRKSKSKDNPFLL